MISVLFILATIPLVDMAYRQYKKTESERIIIPLSSTRKAEKIGELCGYDIYEITCDREIKGYIPIPEKRK